MTSDCTTDRTGHWSGRNWLILTLVLAASSRIAAFGIYDVPGFPDTHGYRSYADAILNNPEFWEKINISGLTVAGLRSIGYPAVMALATWAAGDAREMALQSLQCLAFVLACWPLFLAAEAMLKSSFQAFLTVMSVILSYGIAFDLAILPDGFFKSAWIASAAMATIASIKSNRLFRFHLLATSLLFIVMAGLRGNGHHMALLLFPLIVLAIFANTKSTASRAGWLALVFVPMFIFQAGISSWNERRSGTYFYTAGGALALMQPVTKMQARDPNVVSGPDQLSSMMRELNPKAEYAPLYDVVEEMNNRYGYSLVEIQAIATALYVKTVLNHPDIFLKMFVRNFDDKFALGLINPALGLNEGVYLITNERVFPGFSRLFKETPSPSGILYGIIYVVFAIPSVLLTALALFIAPFLASIRWRAMGQAGETSRARPDQAALAIWASVFLGICYYCALFVELRYLTAFQPFAVILGLYCANTFVAHWKHRRAAPTGPA